MPSGNKESVKYHEMQLSWGNFKGPTLLEKPQIYWMEVNTVADCVHGNVQSVKAQTEEFETFGIRSIK